MFLLELKLVPNTGKVFRTENVQHICYATSDIFGCVIFERNCVIDGVENMHYRATYK